MGIKVQKNSILVDDREYWKNRHSHSADLTASGVKSVNVNSNEYIYKILSEQYAKLLDSLDLKKVKSVLDCGFGDGYFLKFYKTLFPQIEIEGVDISEDAKRKIDFIPKNKLYVSDLEDFSPNKKFDLVHSFDVMYHILDDSDYIGSLTNVANLSNKYVVLHERFLKKVSPVSSKHVRMRRSEFTNQILNSRGFFLTREIPTHFFAMRLPTYKLNKYFPKVLYKIDSYVAENLHPSLQEFLASHYIRVYSKNTLA